jgi:hypothetical protein
MRTWKISHTLLFPATTNTRNEHGMIASHSMRLGKKNSTNLEQLDYLQDLNRLLFSNVVDQAAQKTECPQTCLWWIQWYKWDRRGFSQEPYELYGPSSLDFLCNSSSPFFFFSKINIAASENRHVGCNSLSLCPLLVPNIFILKNNFPLTGQH